MDTPIPVVLFIGAVFCLSLLYLGRALHQLYLIRELAARWLKDLNSDPLYHGLAPYGRSYHHGRAHQKQACALELCKILNLDLDLLSPNDDR